MSSKKFMPFIPVKEVVFPGVVTTVFVGRDKSIKSLEASLLSDNKLMLFLQRDREEENPPIPSGISSTGVLVNIIQSTKLPDGIVRVLLESEGRVKLINVNDESPFYSAEYEDLILSEGPEKETEAVKRKLFDKFEAYLRATNKLSPELILSIKSIKSVHKLLDLIASNINISVDQKQDILECLNLQDKAYKILSMIQEELEVIDLEKTIDTKVKDQMSSLQRSYYLKEKIKAIKEELGEESLMDEVDDVKDAIDEAKLPKHVKKKLNSEVSKLSKMPPYSSEFSVVRNYIETVLELPWKKETKDVINIEKAEKILNEAHYGLEEVKERILEFLAVKQLNKSITGSILCLSGPPGVGKTSLSRSIAKSLGRRFARISLGGVRDEAEIRGHRKTYVGAMPGRIIKELKYVNSNNPLILLDEIDKMAHDRGDPASALLEVLDPEQNKEFIDNYIEIPFDISKAFFIATANDISAIPPALKDRLEIIKLNSYTDVEKMHIAKIYLIPKSKEDNGVKNLSIKLSDDMILKIIHEYTREAGVRQLKRELDKLFRKIAKQSLVKNIKEVEINEQSIEKYLGKVKFLKDRMRKKEGKQGIVNGLAWTPVGGCTLEVQSTSMPGITGKAQLITTGQLGDVMSESTKVALSYVRSISKQLNLEDSIFSKKDLHIHFPEGATPKDGPSAGIAIVTAVISALTGKKVRQDVAMTGEVTITGDVLPVGGIKEKVIGAHRAGIREVILPIDNKSSVDDLPKEIRDEMKIDFAKTYSEDVMDKVFAEEL